MALATYEKALKKIRKDMGIRITDNTQLDKVGRLLFRDRWRGCYPADIDPKVSREQPYAIINTKRSPGEHWMSCVWVNPRTRLIYDSFGRKALTITSDPKKMAPKGVRVVETEPDPEQKILQTDCGQRCLAFLVAVSLHGVEAAKAI